MFSIETVIVPPFSVGVDISIVIAIVNWVVLIYHPLKCPISIPNP